MSIATATTSPRPDRVALMGLEFAAFSERETIDYVLGALAERRGGWISTVNLAILRQWRRRQEVRDLLSQADIVVADGMPLIWAGGIQGSPLPERVAGSTLVRTLSQAASAVGASIFLLGGNPGTADAAAEALMESCRIRVAGTLCPPVGFENDPVWIDRIRRSLCESGPDIVFVGLGCPKQERLIVGLREHMPRAWFIPCGISFSFLAGEVQRAPVMLQRLGLEWLHRLFQEPQRLFRRYLVEGPPFLFELLWSALIVRARGAGASG